MKCRQCEDKTEVRIMNLWDTDVRASGMGDALAEPRELLVSVSDWQHHTYLHGLSMRQPRALQMSSNTQDLQNQSSKMRHIIVLELVCVVTQ
jgi:hypothetical protein